MYIQYWVYNTVTYQLIILREFRSIAILPLFLLRSGRRAICRIPRNRIIVCAGSASILIIPRIFFIVVCQQSPCNVFVCLQGVFGVVQIVEQYYFPVNLASKYSIINTLSWSFQICPRWFYKSLTWLQYFSTIFTLSPLSVVIATLDDLAHSTSLKLQGSRSSYLSMFKLRVSQFIRLQEISTLSDSCMHVDQHYSILFHCFQVVLKSTSMVLNVASFRYRKYDSNLAKSVMVLSESVESALEVVLMQFQRGLAPRLNYIEYNDDDNMFVINFVIKMAIIGRRQTSTIPQCRLQF